MPQDFVKKAHECDFGTTCDERILEHIIQTIENENLIQKCIAKGWTLSEFLSEAGQMEDICLQVRDMKISSHERDIARVDTYKTEAKSRQYIKNSPTRKYRTQQCCHCGSARVHADMKDCPAYGKSAINVEN